MKIDDLIHALTVLPQLLERLSALLEEGSSAAGPDDILNTKQAAALLRIGPSELTALVKSGVIPAWLIGNGYRYSRHQVLAAFHAQAQRAADAAQGGTNA